MKEKNKKLGMRTLRFFPGKGKEERYDSEAMLSLVKPTYDTLFQHYPMKPNYWQWVTAGS